MRKSNQPEDEREPVHELGDIIEAREERTSAFADDIDDREDIHIPEDIDVDDALTFPHPRAGRKKGKRLPVDLERQGTSDEILGRPEPQESDFDYDDSVEEMLPTDYAGDYNEALSTDVYDTEDTVVEDIINHAGDMDADDVLYEEEIPEPMPSKFTGEDTGEQNL